MWSFSARISFADSRKTHSRSLLTRYAFSSADLINKTRTRTFARKFFFDRRLVCSGSQQGQRNNISTIIVSGCNPFWRVCLCQLTTKSDVDTWSPTHICRSAAEIATQSDSVTHDNVTKRSVKWFAPNVRALLHDIFSDALTCAVFFFSRDSEVFPFRRASLNRRMSKRSITRCRTPISLSKQIAQWIDDHIAWSVSAISECAACRIPQLAGSTSSQRTLECRDGFSLSSLTLFKLISIRMISLNIVYGYSFDEHHSTRELDITALVSHPMILAGFLLTFDQVARESCWKTILYFHWAIMETWPKPRVWDYSSHSSNCFMDLRNSMNALQDLFPSACRIDRDTLLSVSIHMRCKQVSGPCFNHNCSFAVCDLKSLTVQSFDVIRDTDSLLHTRVCIENCFCCRCRMIVVRRQSLLQSRVTTGLSLSILKTKWKYRILRGSWFLKHASMMLSHDVKRCLNLIGNSIGQLVRSDAPDLSKHCSYECIVVKLVFDEPPQER